MVARYQLLTRLRSEELAALEADILARGVLVPVEVDDEGQVLDGHNRVQIADKHGLKYETIVRQFETEREKREHIYRLNLCRRHMEGWQWGQAFAGLLAERGVERKRGRRWNSKSVTITELAAEVGVGPDTTKHRLAQWDLYKILTAAEQEAVLEKSKTLAQVKRERKERKREAKRRANAEAIANAPTLGEALAHPFSTIVVDPPWDWSDEGDVDQLGRARPTYKTMTLEELLAFPLGERADKDCHLYLWITNRSLPKGFSLLDAWGFRYVTCITWCKSSFGMGNYFRGSTEHVLFGVRGSLSLQRKDVGTWFAADRGPQGHSSKPDEFYTLVESCSPAPYLDVFSRRERDGWTCWGGEL